MNREQLVKDSLTYMQGKIRNLPQPYFQICRSVLNDARFQDGFGAHMMHHAYKGGLPVHTSEVLQYALSMSIPFSSDRIDRNVIIVTAIVHDYYKIFDYTWDEENKQILKTDYRARIRHLAGSYGWFMQQVAKYDIVRFETEKIEHALLAHHGRREWGAAVEPQTLEAAIIHYADMLSANFGENKL